MSEFKITMENPLAYQTRDGVPVEIVYISKDENIRGPVIAKVPDGSKDILVAYTLDGFFYMDGLSSEQDLILRSTTKKYKVLLFNVGDAYYTMTCDSEETYVSLKTRQEYARDLTDWVEYTP